MAKRKLSTAVTKKTKSAIDLAVMSTDNRAQHTTEPGRSTVKMSISMTPEEQAELDKRVGAFRAAGRRDLKQSRLARVALRMMLNATDDEVLRVADTVENLESRRGNRKSY